MLVSTPTRRAVRLSLGRLGARLVPVLLAACYSYTPLATVAPTPGLRLSLALTDQGRVGVAPVMGAGLDRVEGTLVRVTDSSYVVQVASVTDVRGAVTKWVGETVTIERRGSRTHPSAGSPGPGPISRRVASQPRWRRS